MRYFILLLIVIALFETSLGNPKTNEKKEKKGMCFHFNSLFRYLMKYFPSTPDFKQLFAKPQKPDAPPPSEKKTTGSAVKIKQVSPNSDVSSCREEFRDIPGHTMCKKDKGKAIRWGVSETEKLEIVKQHNMLRGSIEPPATDLPVMLWDDRLAEVAEKWAKQCTNQHDKVRTIPSLGSTTVGQNVAGGQPNWTVAIQMWWDEIEMWKYGPEPDTYLGFNGWLKVGHFTQMAQNGTYLVGCGYAYTDDDPFRYKRYYVCNYAAGQSDLGKPYTQGKRCSKCPNFCKNGLCDCGGKKCDNGGKLNVETCECECKKLYTGPSCEQLSCPDEDMWVCGKTWTADLCDHYANVPFDCPYMCGKCKSTGKKAKKASKYGASKTGNKNAFTSKHGCKYSGERASREECKKKYGKNGNDIPQCGSMGGSLSCKECDRFSNVRSEMCPVMCGLCDPPCDGKVCSNGGTLNTDTCECACAPPYVPPTCDDADCSKPDGKSCLAWPKSYCKKYANVPEQCPQRCGICP
ncbi:uncharacterized protein LOC134236905 isoform X1 [Saccostrea cucullata]|uniref:uncharacterized protein LOC134236905 isoform X1 n=1 Tax=Saccostrea cuccullata TaxID=36930 RepID=UPI002ECFD351